MAGELELEILRNIGEVERSDWDRLGPHTSPFTRWDWLDILEVTGCVAGKTGWLPHHLIVKRGPTPVAACPMYLKHHSMGEFVFDFDWADYARELGIGYYPKVLLGVPFTPVTGARFLTAPGEDRWLLVRFIGESLKRIVAANKLSSVHVNFCLRDEAEALEEIGFLPRLGLQFHWENRGYSSFEDYLGAFRSDRRNKIRRERRELSSQHVTIRAVQGDELTPAHVRAMFRLYRAHIDRLDYGRQYLTREFFDEVGRRLRAHLCLILAQRDSEIVAGTFNLQDHEALYGRYWGSVVEERYLYFNVCYYAAIEHCIGKGLKRFEAGAGGSFKRFRGLEPRLTRSMHFVSEERLRRVVARYLRHEREAVLRKQEELLEANPLKGS